jgi:hypothetical protein
MDARPILAQVARVTTLDIDFFIRKTPANITKLKRLATSLGATVFKPFYPVSGLFRLTRDDDALQLDLTTTIHGIRSSQVSGPPDVRAIVRY